MKKFSVLFVLFVLLCAFASVNADCDWDEATCAMLEGVDFGGRTMVVGTWGGTIEDIYRQYIIPEIEAHNGHVEMLLGGSADRVAKIYAEKDNPTMDIAYTNMLESAKGIADGIFEVPSADVVPAYDDLYGIAKQDAYGMSFIALGIAYVPDLFEEAPEWADLWKPEYKGKVSISSYPGSDSEGALTIAGYLNGGDDTTLDLAFSKLAELKPIPLFFSNLDELFMMMDKGDVAAAAVFDAYANTYIDQGINVKFNYPTDPGAIVSMDTLCIVKGAPNPDMAAIWAQMSLSPKVQEAFANQIYFGPTNSKVVLSEEIGSKVVYGEEVANSLIRMSSYLTDHRDEVVERFNREIAED